MIVLGVSAYYHDSAVAIVRDGIIVNAAQKECFKRIRHDEAPRVLQGISRSCCASNACSAQATFSRILPADLVQMKGFGSALWFSRYSMMATFNAVLWLKGRFLVDAAGKLNWIIARASTRRGSCACCATPAIVVSHDYLLPDSPDGPVSSRFPHALALSFMMPRM